ncbi:MAG: glycosyltransferase family 2 protein, partial [Patescibacteria group bacterium]|nr:glycosyltransferase family 2 protein [Patescibacteria group bacterium]
MKQTITVSLVIPCLNEENNIKTLAQKIEIAFTRKFRYEVIWVDDGSTDHTSKEIKKVCQRDKRHKAIILMRRTGQSTALMAGFDHAQGKYIATMDGDNQNDP